MSGGEAYLNALLDKYIQKYQVPAQTNALTPAAAFAATLPTSPAKVVSTLPSVSSIIPTTAAITAAPTLTPAQQLTLAQATLSAIGSQPTSVATNAGIAPSSSVVSSNSTLNLSHPAALYHQTDLSIIQSQIEQLSKKLQRVPETVMDPVTNNKFLSHSASSSASAAPPAPVVSAPVAAAPLSSGGVYQPALSHGASVGGNTRIVYQVPGAGASVQYTQPHHPQPVHQEQKQMQVNELLDASSYATAAPSIPSSSSVAAAAAQQQAADTLHAQRVSIATSMQALTSSPPRVSRRTSASPSPASSPNSRENLKHQLTAAQKQISKQSMQLSEREFALVTANREVDTLRGKVDKFTVLQRAHNTLKAEHAAVYKNLEKSERIRREQLNYIQILHSQIQFLQNNTSGSGMLQNSPIKENGPGRITDEEKFNEVLGQMLSPQQREQQRLFREAADSLTLPQFAGSADAGLTLGHVDPSESQPFASFSPARASIPSRAVKLHDDVVRDNAEIAAAARVGSKVLKESGRPFIPALDLSPERVNATQQIQQQRSHHQLNLSAQPLSPDFKHIPAGIAQFASTTGKTAAARKLQHTIVDDSPVASSPSVSVRPVRPRLSASGAVARSASMKKASPSTAARSVRPSTAATRPVSASVKKKPATTTLNTSTTVPRTRPSTASSTTRTSLSHKPTRAALAATRK